MNVTLIKPDNIVIVDGVARSVNLNSLGPDVEVVRWDDSAGTGEIQYRAGATYTVSVRDLAAEDQDARNARAMNKDLRKLQPRLRAQQLPRGVEQFKDFTPYERFITAWERSI